MGVATIEGTPFRIDPSSITWSYAIKTAVTETVGGKVVQVFGTEISDMTVSGRFATWKEQDAFLRRVEGWIDQATDSDQAPLRFMYPPRKWDLLVYLASFSQPGAGDSIYMATATLAPAWSLTFHIVEDNHGLHALKDKSLKDYIQRISTGIGWKQTEFNGPLGADTVQTYLQGQNVKSIEDLLTKEFSGNSEKESSTG